MEKIIIDRTESLKESIIRDLVTFSLLIFCIWFSGDSKFWSVITYSMFLISLIAKSFSLLEKTNKIFKTKKELIDYIETIEW